MSCTAKRKSLCKDTVISQVRGKRGKMAKGEAVQVIPFLCYDVKLPTSYVEIGKLVLWIIIFCVSRHNFSHMMKKYVRYCNRIHVTDSMYGTA